MIGRTIFAEKGIDAKAARPVMDTAWRQNWLASFYLIPGEPDWPIGKLKDLLERDYYPA